MSKFSELSLPLLSYLWACLGSSELLYEVELTSKFTLRTSLTVQPFASLPSLCEEGVPRLLINLQRVGGLGSRPDDVVLLEDCDSGVKKLADHLGWSQDLASLWDQTKVSMFSSAIRLSIHIARAWNIILVQP